MASNINAKTSQSTVGIVAPGGTINVEGNIIVGAQPQKDRDITIFHLPTLIKTFRGRETEMNELAVLFFEKQHRKVVICGQPGMGKTETAKQFASKSLKDKLVDKVIWINSERREDLLESFKDLAQNFNLPAADDKTKVKYIFEYLHKYKCMFIFDNAVSRNSILEYQPPDDHYILVTSQDKVWGNDFERIELISLTTDGALEVIKSILAKNYNEEYTNQYKHLAEVVSNVPLGLQVILGYVNEFVSEGMSINIVDYISELKKTIIERKISSSLSNPYENSIYGAVCLTLEKMYKLDTESREIRELAFIILNSCAFLKSDNITFDHLMLIIRFKDNYSEHYLMCILKFLDKFSIINWSQDNIKSNIKIHRLMQNILRIFFSSKYININTESYKLCLKYVVQHSFDIFTHRDTVIKYADENIDAFFNFYKEYLDKVKLFKEFKYCVYKLFKVKSCISENDYSLHENMCQSLVEFGCIKTLDKIFQYLGCFKHVFIDYFYLLHTSIEHNQLEVLKLLLENNGDINKGDEDEDTILHEAARDCNLDFIKFLVECKADLSIRNVEGETPLYIFCEVVNDDCKDILEILELLNCNKFKNITDIDGNTILHAACTSNCEKVIELLVCKYNCNVNTRNNLGETPLHVFCEYVTESYKDIEKTLDLLKCDKLKDQTDLQGNSILHAACYNGRSIELILSLVVKYKCEVHQQNKYGDIPLHTIHKNVRATKEDIEIISNILI